MFLLVFSWPYFCQYFPTEKSGEKTRLLRTLLPPPPCAKKGKSRRWRKGGNSWDFTVAQRRGGRRKGRGGRRKKEFLRSGGLALWGACGVVLPPPAPYTHTRPGCKSPPLSCSEERENTSFAIFGFKRREKWGKVHDVGRARIWGRIRTEDH